MKSVIHYFSIFALALTSPGSIVTTLASVAATTTVDASVAYACGDNSTGALGNNSTVKSNVPVAVTATGVLASKTITVVSAGSSHSLALCSDGTLAAWGYNEEGELGNNSTASSSVPVAVYRAGVLAGKTIVSIATGSGHNLALCSDGTLASWGIGTSGELGNNTLTNSSIPVAVNTVGLLAGKTVVAIAAGGSHSLALCSDGTLVAWGINNAGQLGNNTTINSKVPVAVYAAGVLAGRTIVSISGGGSSSLALCSDGFLAAWGDNSIYGGLGNGSTTNSSVPVAVNRSGVLAGKTIVAVSVGGAHCLALCSDNTLAAWGNNDDGELGDGSTTSRSLPVLVNRSGVLADKTIVAVAAGGAHSLALCSDGTVAAWGFNWAGELGIGSYESCSVPAIMLNSSFPSGAKCTAVATGWAHSVMVAGTSSPLSHSHDSSLSRLEFIAGTLSPVLASGATSFTACYTSVVSSVQVIATATASTATITINGVAVVSGTVSGAIPVVAGSNIIVMKVTAQDGSVTLYTVTIDNTAYGVWKAGVFTDPADLNNPAISGEMAMPAHDNITNLMKYALAVSPKASTTDAIPTLSRQNGYLTLIYRKNKLATDMTYTVQAADSPSGNPWTAATTLLSQTDAGTYWMVTIRDSLPYAGHPRRFLRLQVTK